MFANDHTKKEGAILILSKEQLLIAYRTATSTDRRDNAQTSHNKRVSMLNSGVLIDGWMGFESLVAVHSQGRVATVRVIQV